MEASEAANWILQSEDHFVILLNRIVGGSIYEKCNYQPVIRVGGSFYHIKYEAGEPKTDYKSPIFVDSNLNIVD